jgi:hypothetical protein
MRRGVRIRQPVSSPDERDGRRFSSPRASSDGHRRKPLLAVAGATETLRAVAERLGGIPHCDIETLASTWPEALDSSKLTSRIGLRARMLDFLLARRRYSIEIAEKLVPFLRETRDG